MKYEQGEKVVYKPEDKVYDFGYYSQVEGKVVLYYEGECNMQDSIAVNEYDIRRKRPNEIIPVCFNCWKKPEEIEEYKEAAVAEGMTPLQYVQQEEGTYNKENGHFCCTECYIELRMPANPPGKGRWVAP